MRCRAAVAAAIVLAIAPPAARPVGAEPIRVRYTEGITRAFPLLRDPQGSVLARGDLSQVAEGGTVDSRLVFRFEDGSLYDERVVFTQGEVFTLLRYSLIQRGPSFPERLDASVDCQTGQWEVRFQADEESAEEFMSGRLALPPDVYNGMLSILAKNLEERLPAVVQVVAFTPRPRLVKLRLSPADADSITTGAQRIAARRYKIRPDLGLFASVLVSPLPDAHIWIAAGQVPGFLRFEGPLYFMGPVWRIEPQ